MHSQMRWWSWNISIGQEALLLQGWPLGPGWPRSADGARPPLFQRGRCSEQRPGARSGSVARPHALGVGFISLVRAPSISAYLRTRSSSAYWDTVADRLYKIPALALISRASGVISCLKARLGAGRLGLRQRWVIPVPQAKERSAIASASLPRGGRNSARRLKRLGGCHAGQRLEKRVTQNNLPSFAKRMRRRLLEGPRARREDTASHRGGKPHSTRYRRANAPPSYAGDFYA